MPGLIPQAFLNELLSRTDLVELVDSYVPLKKRGTSYLACCPFHNEKTPSFNVVAKKQFYHCFGCGASGNAISFIMAYLNQGFVDAIETLSSRIGLEVPKEGQAKNNHEVLSLYQLLKRTSDFYQLTLKTKGKDAIDYLKNRGLSGEIAKLYQLGYAPQNWNTLENQFRQYKEELITTGMLIQKEDGKTYDRYRHRVMFPIHDRQGRIIGFGGRALEKDQKPKYLNSPETSIFQKSRELYGLHQVLKAKANLENIIIVEGYMDVIALAQHGLLNAVATLGTATSSYHIQLLAKHTKQIIFCFDGDNAGRQAAWRALENCLPELNKGLDVSFCFLPEEHDPDSLVRLEGTEQFKLRLKEAKQLNQYFLETISEGIDTYTVAGRTQLIIAAKPYLLKMQDGPYKDLLLNELARLTHIEAYRITQILADNQPVAEEKEKKVITKSPIRLAIALLIQNPELFSSCKDKIDIDLLDGKNQDILQKLLRQVEKKPMANTAALVEEWRDSHFFDALTKLAGWDHQEPEQELDKKFTDIILFLQKQNLENKINEFLAKSRNQGLTLTERLNLQDMMKRRHQQTSLKS